MKKNGCWDTVCFIFPTHYRMTLLAKPKVFALPLRFLKQAHRATEA